jgi:predicted MPP superfamily phosphohydrolase
MRILQISDFHFKKNSNIFKQDNIVKSIVSSLKQNQSIDLIIFNGDLVFNGNDLNSAHKLLFDTILTELKMDISQIVICQGNHDINQRENLKSLADYSIANLNINEKINKFINDSNPDFINL